MLKVGNVIEERKSNGYWGFGKKFCGMKGGEIMLLG